MRPLPRGRDLENQAEVTPSALRARARWPIKWTYFFAIVGVGAFVACVVVYAVLNPATRGN